MFFLQYQNHTNAHQQYHINYSVKQRRITLIVARTNEL